MDDPGLKDRRQRTCADAVVEFLRAHSDDTFFSMTPTFPRIGVSRKPRPVHFDQDLVLAMFGGDKVDLDAAPTRLQHFCFEVAGLEAMKAHLDTEHVLPRCWDGTRRRPPNLGG